MVGVAMRLTVSVRGSLGLDDDRRLTDELTTATGLAWRLEPAPAGDHLDGAVTEIVLTAVLGKTTELVVGAVVEKVRERLDQWRGEHLDEPDYVITRTTADEAGVAHEAVARDDADDGSRPQDPTPEG